MTLKWLSSTHRQALGFGLALVALYALGAQGNAASWPLFGLTLLLGVVALGADGISKTVTPLVKKRGGKPLAFAGIQLAAWATGILLAFGALYLISPNPAFALGAFAGLLYLVLNELLPTTWTPSGIRTSLSELAWALGLAAWAWIIVSTALATRSPLDVVTSCSMTPALQRGDLIVLSGRDVSARESVTTSLSFQQFLTASSVKYEDCEQQYSDGRVRPNRCQVELTVPGGRTISLAPGGEGDVIVYEPSPRVNGVDLIIHRAMLQVTASDGVFFMTKGDNNAVLDQSTGLAGATPATVHGKMLARVPILGYLKLLLFLQFENPGNCQYQTVPTAAN